MRLKLSIVAVLVLGVVGSGFAFNRAGEVSVRKVVKLNLGWKFSKADGTTATASQTNFNDAGWATVSVPHTIDTVEPTLQKEARTFQGDAWYRRPIQLPAGSSGKRYSLQFEGAMQTANVWVNGTSVGTHDNSGYTGFAFDITNAMGASTSATCAVKLNNQYSADIPPGRSDLPAPDFFLYSGLYRNVWLVVTDKVYIPFCGQFITTPTATSTSGVVQIKTIVKNENTDISNCAVQVSIRNQAGTEVGTGTLSKSVPANDTSVYVISVSITNPSLWSPTNPNLYHVYTKLVVGGSPIDDYSATFGFRTLAWSATNGFSLNGTNLKIKGVCDHQFFAWVQNAVPASRWAVEFKLIKAAGYNAIRCAHYPRSQAYYDAADSIGLLLMVEVPTWGYGLLSEVYSDAFWNRLNNCATEMVTQGYNHPSIFLWGIFNEPYNKKANSEYVTQFTRLKNTIKSIDNIRSVTVAQNDAGARSNGNVVDVVGLNYQIIKSAGYDNTSTKSFITTEYFEGWKYFCPRGSSGEASFTQRGLDAYDAIVAQGGMPIDQIYRDQIGGHFMWVFADYNAYWNAVSPAGADITWTDATAFGKQMGMTDFYRIPKELYYKMAEKLGGTVTPDYPISGTATKLDVKPDLTTLTADGSDFSIITIAFRDNNNKCITNTGNIALTVTGPGTPLGPLTVTAAAGKAGFIIRATTIPGSISITATSGNLQGQATISTVPDGSTPILVPQTKHSANNIAPFSLKIHDKVIALHTNNTQPIHLNIIGLNGNVITSLNSAKSFSLNKQTLGSGIYLLRATQGSYTVTRTITQIQK